MSGEELRILGATDPLKGNNASGAKTTRLSEKEQAAIELLNRITGKKGYKESMTTSELQKELEKDLKALHSRRGIDDRRRGVDGIGRISDDAYDAAMDVLEKQMAVRASLYQGSAPQLVQKYANMTRHLVGNGDIDIDITNPDHVRGFVAYALEDEYKNGKISKEQYQAAKKYAETKGASHFFKSIGRGITGKESESNLVFKSVGQNNNVAQIRHSEEGPQYEAKLQEKLDNAGISDELIYQIGDNLVGAEAVVSYSNKKIQAGEAQFITDELNKYARANGATERFTVDEAKEIMKGAGYGIEKAVDGKKVVRDAVLPAAIGAAAGVPIALYHLDVDQVVDVTYGDLGGGDHVHNSVDKYPVAWAPAVTAALGAGLGALNSIKMQKARVEDKAIPVQIDTNITSFKDYVDFVVESESFPTKNAKEMAMRIAAYYTDKDGNLLKDQLIDAYRHAGGSADVENEGSDNNRDASVLNHREALALLTKLESGEIKVQKPQNTQPTAPAVTPTPAPAEENHYVTLQTEIEETSEPTDCYEVKLGDNWTDVIMNVYGIKNYDDVKHIVRQVKDKYFEEMKANGTLPAGVTSSRDAFFPKVGEELCLPCKVYGKNPKNEYTLNVNVDFERQAPSEDYKGASYESTSNPFMNTKTDAFYIVNSHDNEALNRETYAGKDKQEAENIVRSYEDRFGIKRTETEYVNGVRTK